MKHRLTIVLVGLALLVAQLACLGSSTPPHYGVFLKKGSSFVEMEAFQGGPPSLDVEGIPTASDSQPLIVMWSPEVDLGLLVLVDEQRGGSIAYDVAPGDEEGILEIRPGDPLDPGVYCFHQGNPMLPASRLPVWCFRVP